MIDLRIEGNPAGYRRSYLPNTSEKRYLLSQRARSQKCISLQNFPLVICSNNCRSNLMLICVGPNNPRLLTRGALIFLFLKEEAHHVQTYYNTKCSV
jgi:hypothetical protein